MPTGHPRPRPASTTPICAVCGRPETERKLVAFCLNRQVVRNGRRTTRGCGRVTLCESCWREMTQMPGGRRPKVKRAP